MSLLISTSFVRVYQIGPDDYVLVTKEETEDADSVQFRFELTDGVETKVAMSFKDEEQRDDSFEAVTEEQVLTVVTKFRHKFT